MPNQTKKNSQNNTKKNSLNNKSKSQKGNNNNTFSFIKAIKSNQFRVILGVFTLLFSILLLFSFFSYINTWKHDAVIFETGLWNASLDENIKSENFAGKFGGWLAYTFIKRGFGIASFLIIPALILIGLKLLSVNIKRFNFYILSLISLLIYFSILTSAIFPNSENPFMGGIFGSQAVDFIVFHIGKIGLVFFLIFVGITLFSIILPKLFLSTLNKIKNTKLRLRKSEVATDDSIPFNNNNIEEKQNSENNTYNPVVDLNSQTVETKDSQFQTTFIDFSEKQNTENETIESTFEPMVENNSDIPFEITNTSQEIDLELNIEESEASENYGSLDSVYDPRKDLDSFVQPNIDLLEEYGSGKINIDKQELEANKLRIESTLQNYGIKIDRIFATVGPTVTLYEIVPAPGIRISKIKNLEDDIALSLSALGIRIIAPIPGKGTIGIEVPNRNAEIVSLKSLISSPQFANTTFDLPIALGKTITNEPYIADLTKMPHLLMAGATGQGKSVGLNTIIASLLFKKHPAELKFVLVDPKKVELPLFSKIERHFLAKLPDAEEAIITDTSQVVKTLKGLTIEMDDRYNLLKAASCRNIKEYNEKFINRKLNPEKGHNFLPYIVLIVDEFADLIMTAGKEVEGPIARIAQLARAVGIHLVIATQRPSVNIITGVIKANFPTRVAFRVSAKVDSRTILDASGADQLIGRGDMLISNGSRLDRIQCAFIDTPELEKIAEFIGSQRAYPSAYELPEVISEDEEAKKDFNFDERDAMFAEAARIIVQNQHGSTSLLQRKLKLGYNRAGRIIDQLEAAGIVGPFEGSKAREVLIKDMDSLEQLLIMYNAV